MQSVNEMFSQMLFAQHCVSTSPDQNQSTPLSAVEQQILDNIQALLYSPESLSQHVSMLPSILSSLINTIDNPEIDFVTIVTDLCEQPDVAREILQIANSDMYRTKGKREVTTIAHATAVIGLVSVAYIASTVLMSHATRTKSSYFDRFSHLIQKHSLQTAMACRDLAHDNDTVNEFCGHLLGLINIVGMVYCFNCLSTQLGTLGYDQHPSAQLYKQVCQRWAGEITVEIAKEWSLPAPMITALVQFNSPNESKQNAYLAQLLTLADLTSKVTILMDGLLIDRPQALELLMSKGLDQNYIENYFDMSTCL